MSVIQPDHPRDTSSPFKLNSLTPLSSFPCSAFCCSSYLMLDGAPRSLSHEVYRLGRCDVWPRVEVSDLHKPAARRVAARPGRQRLAHYNPQERRRRNDEAAAIARFPRGHAAKIPCLPLRGRTVSLARTYSTAASPGAPCDPGARVAPRGHVAPPRAAVSAAWASVWAAAPWPLGHRARPPRRRPRRPYSLSCPP